MNTDLARSQNPEEKQLAEKLVKLAALEAELTQRELELATLSTEMRNFEAVYLRRVGARYAKLDELEARLAEAQAKLNPEDKKAAEWMAQARIRAHESAKATSDTSDTPQRDKPTPSEELRKLYRDVAKKIHPDLCIDDDERLRRQKMMAEVNRAYEDCDAERLKQILNDWESGPEGVNGEDVGAKLVRALRKIAGIETRLEQMASEIAVMQKMDLYQLKMEVQEAVPERDLLAELADRVDVDIAIAEEQLSKLMQWSKCD